MREKALPEKQRPSYYLPERQTWDAWVNAAIEATTLTQTEFVEPEIVAKDTIGEQLCRDIWRDIASGAASNEGHIVLIQFVRLESDRLQLGWYEEPDRIVVELVNGILYGRSFEIEDFLKVPANGYCFRSTIKEIIAGKIGIRNVE